MGHYSFLFIHLDLIKKVNFFCNNPQSTLGPTKYNNSFINLFQNLRNAAKHHIYRNKIINFKITKAVFF